MGTISNQNATDDWWQAGSGTTYDNTYLAVRSHAVLASRRFTVLQFDLSGSIAQGDTIDTCVLDLVVSEAVASWVDMDCEVYAEDVDSASANLTSIYTMTKTTANVAWVDTTGNSQGTAMTSPELKTVLQEVVDRPSWDGTVNFILWGTTTTGGYGTFGSLDQATYTKPNISVTYSASTLDGNANPGAATVTTTVPAVKTDPVNVSPAAVGVAVTASPDTSGTGPSVAQPDAATVAVSVPRPAIETTGGFAAGSGRAGRDYTVFWPTGNDVDAGDAPPVVHWIHGGSFTSGTRLRSDTNENACPLSWSEHVRAQGFVVVSSDYNPSTISAANYLCSGPTHPVAIKDVKTHIKEVQDDLGVDTDRYFLAAHSAGSQIALMVALTVGDTNDYTGYNNFNTTNILNTTEGRDGWYTGSYAGAVQDYDYNYEVWGGGSSPDWALTTAGDIQPIKGVFCYAPLWAMSDAQDAGADQRNVLRNYFGQVPNGGYVANLNFEGDPDDYVTPVSGSVHHDVRGTTKRLPTTSGPNGSGIAFAAASSSSDTVLPAAYGIDAMVTRFNAEGIAVDSAVKTMTSAGDVVLDAADVERNGLTRIELPSGTAHEDVTFDSAPEDFITWANEVSIVDGTVTGEPAFVIPVTAPTPTISVSANVAPDAVAVAVTASADTLGGLSADADAEAAAATVTVGASEGSTSGEITYPAAVPVAFDVPTVDASADASITVTASTVGVTVPTVSIETNSNVSASPATVSTSVSAVSTAVGVAPDPVTVTVTAPAADGGVSDTADAEAATAGVTALDATAVGTFETQPDAATVAVTVPTHTANPGGGAVPDSLTVDVAVPAPTITDGQQVAPDAATIAVTAPDGSAAHGGGGTGVATVATTVPTPDISIGASVPNVGVEVVVFVSPSVTAQATGSAPGEAAAVTLEVPAPAVSVGETVTPDAATVTITADDAAAIGGAGATPEPATVDFVAVDAAALRVDADGEAADVAVSVPTPTIGASAEVVLAAIVVSALVRPVAVSTGATNLRIRDSRRRADYAASHRRSDFTNSARRPST